MADPESHSIQDVDKDGSRRENYGLPLEGYPSGQRGQTVNLLAHAFGGSNPPPSTSFFASRFEDTSDEVRV